MKELTAQPYFGGMLTVAAYWLGMKIQKKTRLAICNGMLIAVLIPIHMLRHGETVFLDDYTVERLSRELGVPVQVVDEDGFALVDAMFAAE